MKRLLLLCILLFPSLAGADGVLTPAANPPIVPLYDYRSGILLQDDFIFGATGNFGWGGFNVAANNAIAGRPGLVNITTTAVSATIGRLHTSSEMIFPNYPTLLKWVLITNHVDANTTFRIGVQNTATGNPATSGVYFEKLAADTNLFCVTRHASAETRTDTGVAAQTATYTTYDIDFSSTRVIFSINGVVKCTNTTNLTTVRQFAEVFMINTAAAAKTIDVDYFEARIGGLSR